jgi:hypothetical protein
LFGTSSTHSPFAATAACFTETGTESESDADCPIVQLQKRRERFERRLRLRLAVFAKRGARRGIVRDERQEVHGATPRGVTRRPSQPVHDLPHPARLRHGYARLRGGRKRVVPVLPRDAAVDEQHRGALGERLREDVRVHQAARRPDPARVHHPEPRRDRAGQVDKATKRVGDARLQRRSRRRRRRRRVRGLVVVIRGSGLVVLILLIALVVPRALLLRVCGVVRFQEVVHDVHQPGHGVELGGPIARRPGLFVRSKHLQKLRARLGAG